MAVISQQVAEGSAVEVWCPLSNHWADGFNVEHVDDGGAILRRVSDNQLLPVALPLERVRAASPIPRQLGLR